jgi:hypothetical protein
MSPGAGTNDAMDAIVTMCPFRRCSMPGRNARMSTKCEIRFTWNSFWHSALLVWCLSVFGHVEEEEEVTLRIVFPYVIPALLMSTLTSPCASRIDWQRASTADISARSHW